MGITDTRYWCGTEETRVEVTTDTPARGGWFARGVAGGRVHRWRLDPVPGGAAATLPTREQPPDLRCPRHPDESWAYAVTGHFGRVTDCVAGGADPAALRDASWRADPPRWLDRCRLEPTPEPGPLPAPARPPLPSPAPAGRLDDWGAACRSDDQGVLWATFSGGPGTTPTWGLVFGQQTGRAYTRQSSEVLAAGVGDSGRFEASNLLTSGPHGRLTCARAVDPEWTTWVFAVMADDRVVDCLAVGHDPVGLLAGVYEDRREGPPPPAALTAAFGACRVRWGEPAAGLPVPRRPLRDPEPTLQVAPDCPLPRPALPPVEGVVAVFDAPGGPSFLTSGGGVRSSRAPDIVVGGGLPWPLDVAVAGGVAWRLDRQNLVRIDADGSAWTIPLPLGPDERAYDHVLALRDHRVVVWGQRNETADATNNRFDLAVFDGAWKVDRDQLGRQSVQALVELPDGSLVGVGSQIVPWIDHAFGAPWWEGADQILEAADVLPDGSLRALSYDLIVEGRPGGAFVARARPGAEAEVEVERPVPLPVTSEGHTWSVDRGSVLRDGVVFWAIPRSTPAPAPADWTEGRVPGPPGAVRSGALGPDGRAVAVADDGTWLRQDGAWRLDPRPPPQNAWVRWADDGPLLVSREGVWRWDDGWERFLDTFSPSVAGPRSDRLLVVPSKPDEGPREAPFLWDGGTRSPIALPSPARSAGGGPGAWWIGTQDGGWRWTEGGWRRWWSPGLSPRELPSGDVVVRSDDGEFVLPACPP